jgi:hypothetical protein
VDSSTHHKNPTHTLSIIIIQLAHQSSHHTKDSTQHDLTSVASDLLQRRTPIPMIEAEGQASHKSLT